MSLENTIMAENPPIRFRAEPTIHARISAAATRATSASKGEAIDPSDMARRLLLIGLNAVEHCTSCVAGLPCDLHSIGEVRGGRSKREDATNGDEYKTIVAVYFDEFRKARACDPVFLDQDGRAIKTMLKAIGASKAIEAIRGAFADPFWRGKSTIRTIASDPAKHIGRAAPRSTLQTSDSASPFARKDEIR